LITANFYSHLDYNSKMLSAETIARVLDGEKMETDNREDSADSKKNRKPSE
jgi:hypothetical protein